MIDEYELKNVLITGRLECCVKNNQNINSYQPGKIYDWELEVLLGKYTFKVSHRGTNPFSGVECVFEEGNPLPIWSCDYVGYAKLKRPLTTKEIYGFLKKGRGMYLKERKGIYLKFRKVTFSNFGFDQGYFSYQLRFNGNSSGGLLQIEEIYHQGDLVCQQISAGHLNTKDKCPESET